MQVYITGAHNTGKTTLALILSKELGLTYSRELARDTLISLRKSWPGDVSSFGPDCMGALEYLMFESMLFCWFASLKNRVGFVSDRCVFDVIAYTERFMKCYTDELRVGDLVEPYERIHSFMKMFQHVDTREDTVYIYARPVGIVDSASRDIDEIVGSHISSLQKICPNIKVIEYTRKDTFEDTEKWIRSTFIPLVESIS